MPELTLTPAGLPASALPLARPDGHEPPPGSTPYYITLTPDEIVRHNSHFFVHERALRGEFDAYRGEYVVVAPDGAVLAHTDLDRDSGLREALDLASEKACEAGISPNHLIHYYVTPLEYC